MNIFLSAVFDSIDLTPIEKLQYAGQVTRLFNEANKIKNAPSKGIERIRITKMINEIAVELGLGKQTNIEVSDISSAKSYFDSNLKGKVVKTVAGDVHTSALLGVSLSVG